MTEIRLPTIYCILLRYHDRAHRLRCFDFTMNDRVIRRFGTFHVLPCVYSCMLFFTSLTMTWLANSCKLWLSCTCLFEPAGLARRMRNSEKFQVTCVWVFTLVAIFADILPSFFKSSHCFSNYFHCFLPTCFGYKWWGYQFCAILSFVWGYMWRVVEIIRLVSNVRVQLKEFDLSHLLEVETLICVYCKYLRFVGMY